MRELQMSLSLCLHGFERSQIVYHTASLASDAYCFCPDRSRSLKLTRASWRRLFANRIRKADPSSGSSSGAMLRSAGPLDPGCSSPAHHAPNIQIILVAATCVLMCGLQLMLPALNGLAQQPLPHAPHRQPSCLAGGTCTWPTQNAVAELHNKAIPQVASHVQCCSTQQTSKTTCTVHCVKL